MFLYKVFVGLCLYVLSAVSFSHVIGITDTAIKVNADNISLVYTLPLANINKLNVKQTNLLENTIIQGFVIENKIDNKIQVCGGKLISKKRLENIDSEQFHIRYTCDQRLTNLSISYLLAFSKKEHHKNYVRLSIAGRSQNFTYSASKKVHVLPIEKLLAGWGEGAKSVDLSATEKNAPDTDQYSNKVTSLSELLLQSTHYFLIGVEHILLGYDHVLFLIGLLLLPLNFRSIVIVATSFTVAHSITLALSVFEVFTLPAPYVEAIIALSIVYIAIDNIRALKDNNSLFSLQNKAVAPWKKRSLITFLFGLLHGFGFSYVLKEIGLGDHIAGSLLFFNLGVELGQLLIIAVCFPVLWFVFRKAWGKAFSITLSVLVGLMGLFWLIERLYSLA